MMTHRLFVSAALLLMIAATAVVADPPAAPALATPPKPAVDPAEEISQIPPLPQTPAGVHKLLFARPFTLENGYEFEWRAEKPTVTAGWLLVLEVDPALVFPRQTAEPILYIGKTTGERINLGHQSGRIVVIVPSNLNEKGEVALDLNEALMWFGTPGLPEQVDAGTIESARGAALAATIAPFPREVINAARAKSGDTLNASDRTSLRQAAAELIKTYSPQEAELIDSILAEQPAQDQSQQPKQE